MLRKFVAPEIIFGAGARHQLGNYAKSFHARRVLVVSDPGVVKAGWAAQVEADLREAGMETRLFSAISPNPRTAEVAAGADFYREHNCDLIVAIGGGSPMDCAKGIGIVATNHAAIVNFKGVDRIGIPVPPLVFIPTTAGTSADVSQFAIISNETEHYKFAIISKAVVPDVALVDHETTATMSPYLTACTGVDALVHAIEAFVSTGSGPMTDLYALDAIRLINRYLAPLVNGQTDSEHRGFIMEASLKAGLAFSNAILGAVHAMAHSLGGYLDLPHGECNAMLLDHVVDFNFPHAVERYTRIAAHMGLPVQGQTPDQVQSLLVEHLRAFKRSVGIEKHLGQAGVRESDIGPLSVKAYHDPCLLTNPRPASQADLAAIYREAL